MTPNLLVFGKPQPGASPKALLGERTLLGHNNYLKGKFLVSYQSEGGPGLVLDVNKWLIIYPRS